MPANRFLPLEWESRLEEIDLEILRQAAICRVALLDPGAVERVLANDAGVCGATHEAAFRTLRGLLYLHYTEVLHISEGLSPEIAQVIANRVREHLRHRTSTQLGGMAG